MHLKLSDISTIKFGLHQTNQVKGTVKYLLARHFDTNLQPSLFEESYLEKDARVEKAILQDNDVLFTGKGFRQFAWAYQEAFGDAVASSVFYVIKPDISVVLPDYLSIILNSDKMKHTFKVISLGVAIPSIPKTELKEIKIPVPPIEQQQKIIAFASLHQQEIDLTQQLLQKKKDIFNSYLKKRLTDE